MTCTGRPPACADTSRIAVGTHLVDPVLHAEVAVLERDLAVLHEVRRPAGVHEVLDQRAAAAQVEAERGRGQRRHQQHRVALLADLGGRPVVVDLAQRRPRRSGCAASGAGRPARRRAPCARRCWPPRRPGRASGSDPWSRKYPSRVGVDSMVARRGYKQTMKWTRAAALGAAALGAVAAHDLTQKQHAILRNFPVVGHLRFQLERFGPELRQYIVTSNDEERPFSRDQRRWVYASLEAARTTTSGSAPTTTSRTPTGYADHQAPHVPGAGRADRRARPRGEPAARRRRCWAGRAAGGTRSGPASVVNVSGMSFGALSGNAIEALNRGAALAGCLQNTGEGAISPYHRNGGDLVFQIGTSYFGCRDERRPLRPEPAQGPGRVGAGPRHRDQAVPGRQARPRRDAARGQGERGDRRDPRHPARRRLCVAEPAHGVPRRRLDARLRRAGRRRDRAAGRHQVRRRQPASSGTTWSSRWRPAARRRLRQHRRRRGRHRRGADDLRRRGGLPVPGRLRPRLPAVRRRPGSPTT